MDNLIDILNQWAGIALLGLLFLFVLFGFLWGVGRGLKRSWMRLATVVGFIGLALLITPPISRALYASPAVGKLITVFYADWDNQTVEQFADVKINDMLEDGDTETLVARVRAEMPDFEIFAEGIGFAVVNIVVFFLLFFFMKWLSWVVYAILAGNFARKREKAVKGVKIKKRDLAKIPQHRWWGGLVGVASGLVMFLFFIIALPIGGTMSVLHDVAEYKKFNGEVVLASPSTGVNADADKLFYDIRRIDDALQGNGAGGAAAKVYAGITKYTGIQFLARKAFDYQMTVSLETKDEDNKTQRVVLSNDLVEGANLAEDVLALAARMDRIEDELTAEAQGRGETDYEAAGVDILGEMNNEDYRAVKIVLDKAFGLTAFKVINASAEKVDGLLAAGDKDTNYFNTKTANNVTVQQNSFYAKLADEYGIDGKKADFVSGLSAIVSKVGEQGLNLLRDEMKNYVDLAQYVFTTKVNGETETIYRVLKADADGEKYMEMVEFLAKPSPDATTYGNTVFMELMDRAVLKSQLFALLGADNADKLLGSLTIDKDKKPFIGNGLMYEGKTVVSRDNMLKFMGKNATGDNGQWRKTADVLDGFVLAGAEWTDLPINAGESKIMEYIADAANMGAEKTDKFAMAFFDAANLFGKGDGTPWKFLESYLAEYQVPLIEFGGSSGAAKIDMNKSGGIKDKMVVRLFGAGKDGVNAWDNGTVDAWKYQFRSATIWQMMGDAFGSVLEDQINEMGGDDFQIHFDDPEKVGDVIQNLVPIVTDVVNALNGEDGIDTGALADALLGGDPNNPNYNAILGIADADVSVELKPETYEQTMNALADVLNGADGTNGTVTYDPEHPENGLTGDLDWTQLTPEQQAQLGQHGITDTNDLLGKINSLIKPMQ